MDASFASGALSRNSLPALAPLTGISGRFLNSPSPQAFAYALVKFADVRMNAGDLALNFAVNDFAPVTVSATGGHFAGDAAETGAVTITPAPIAINSLNINTSHPEH